MRLFDKYPALMFALCSALITTSVLGGVWGPLIKNLQEGYAAETERLLDAFEGPLTFALAKDDDLAKIVELQRLQKLHGVISAELGINILHPAFNMRPLVWEGKNIGGLTVHLTRTRWQRLRYRIVERIWTLIVLMGLAGGLIGIAWDKRQRKFWARLQTLLQRIRKRLGTHRIRQHQKSEQVFMPWIRQALAFSPKGLVLLDSHQRLVAFNDVAKNTLRLNLDGVGRHWLDLHASEKWAAALRQSLDVPGKTVNGPDPEFFLLTLLKEGTIPDATWISFTPP